MSMLCIHKILLLFFIRQIPFPQSTIQAPQSRGYHQKNESNPQTCCIHQESFSSAVVPLGRLPLIIYFLQMRQYFFPEQIQYVWVVWKIFGKFVRVDNNPFFLPLILTIIQTDIRFVDNWTNVFSIFQKTTLQSHRCKDGWRQKLPESFWTLHVIKKQPNPAEPVSVVLKF